MTCCEILIRESRSIAHSIRSVGVLWGQDHYLPNCTGSCDLQKECSDAWKENPPGNEACLVLLERAFIVWVNPGRWDVNILPLRLDVAHRILLEIECTRQGKPVCRSHITPISFVQSQHLTSRGLGQVCSFWLGKIPIIMDVCLSRRVPSFLSTFQVPDTVLRFWHALSHLVSHLCRNCLRIVLILLMKILKLSPLTRLRSQ